MESNLTDDRFTLKITLWYLDYIKIKEYVLVECKDFN